MKNTKMFAKAQGVDAKWKSYAFNLAVLNFLLFWLGCCINLLAQTKTVDLHEVPFQLSYPLGIHPESDSIQVDIILGNSDTLITQLIGFQIRFDLNPGSSPAIPLACETFGSWFFTEDETGPEVLYDPLLHSLEFVWDIEEGIAKTGSGLLFSFFMQAEGAESFTNLVSQASGGLLMIDNIDIRSVAPYPAGIHGTEMPSVPDAPELYLQRRSAALYIRYEGGLEVTIFDVKGNRKSYSRFKMNGEAKLDLAGYPDGIYWVRMVDRRGWSWYRKIVLLKG